LSIQIREIVMADNHLPSQVGFQRDEVKTFPALILIASASPCNLKCDGCPATHLPSIRDTYNLEGEQELYLTEANYRKLADECLAHQTEDFHPRIRISGYGEPLMNKKMVDMIEYSCRIGVKTSLITNGLLLNQDRCRRLIASGIESIEISVDAHTPELYKQIRIGGDFDKLCANFRMLRNERERQQTGTIRTKLLTSIVKSPANIDFIDDITAFWMNEGADHVSVRKFLTWGVPELERMQAELKGQDNYLRSDAPCPYPYERLMLDPGGLIRLCPYDDQKKLQDFGHMSNTTIAEVWVGRRFDDVRSCHQKTFLPDKAHELVPLCATCEDRLNRSWTFNYLSIIDK